MDADTECSVSPSIKYQNTQRLQNIKDSTEDTFSSHTDSNVSGIRMSHTVG